MDDLFDQLGLSELRRLKPRQLLSQVLNFALILGTAFMIWKGLSVASDSPSPIVVVLSGRHVLLAHARTPSKPSPPSADTSQTVWSPRSSAATSSSSGTATSR